MTFKERALLAVQRGLSIIPCEPNGKGPLRGAKSRTNTVAGVEGFAAAVPENANYGVCSDETFTILETDDVRKLISLLGPIPRTLTVSARQNRGYWIFRQTEKTLAVKNCPTAPGLFEWRHVNQYCVGFGSVHPITQQPYKIVVDTDPIPFPDDLVDKLLTLDKQHASGRTGSTGEVNQNAYTILRKKYLENLNPNDMFGLDLTISDGRHPTMLSVAGFLHDGTRNEEMLTGLIMGLWEEYCDRPARGGEIEEIVQHAMKGTPCDFTLPEGHPALEQLSDGLKLFGTQAEYEQHMKDKLYAEFTTTQNEQKCDDYVPEPAEDPIYPLKVWKGTDYAEFAEICSRNNFIPKEFLIEALKTVTGAVIGHQLSAPDIEGCIPRFYTVLMGGAGSGKGTSISWAASVFKDVTIEGLQMVNLIWSPATKIQDVPWTELGVCEEGFNSAPGMQRSNEKGQTRWLQTFEELDHLIEGSGIEGSGKSLMGVNRQLYDREEFSTTTTGKRDAIAGKAQNSILAATTPELWSDMFAGKQVRGSGLFQRFNLLASPEGRRKGSLRRPNLEAFKTDFVSRVLLLEKQPRKLEIEDAAIEAMDQWFTQEKFNELDGEVRGRLNVLGWRNALHIAWQRDSGSITVSHMLDAIELSDYQLAMRLRHTPAEGENQDALVENKIQVYVKANKWVNRRDAVRQLNLNRYGRSRIERAITNLVNAGEIQLFEESGSADGRGRKSLFLKWLD